NASVVERLQQGGLVDDAAPRDIDQMQRRLGTREDIGVDQTRRLRRRRQSEDEMIGDFDQLLDAVDGLDARKEIRPGRASQNLDVDAERLDALDDGAADGAEGRE